MKTAKKMMLNFLPATEAEAREANGQLVTDLLALDGTGGFAVTMADHKGPDTRVKVTAGAHQGYVSVYGDLHAVGVCGDGGTDKATKLVSLRYDRERQRWTGRDFHDDRKLTRSNGTDELIAALIDLFNEAPHASV